MLKWSLIGLLILAVIMTVVFFLPGRPSAVRQLADEPQRVERSSQSGASTLPLSGMILDPTSTNDNVGTGMFNQDLEFTSQAPFAVWDHLHNESCEEASLLIAYAWVNNLALNPTFADEELKKIADWEIAKFGFFESTTAEQTAQIAREFYGLKVDLLHNPTVEEIKKEVVEGRLVVMGMAGRLLGNPHFKPPGPIYHMLVIKGYDEQGFFTNDPGTLYGKNYYYSYATIMKAAHDWIGVEEEIYTSPAVALIISK